MAMSAADQKAASDRIMAKEPLTAEERKTYERLMREPPYGSVGEQRECRECGAVFQEIPATKELKAVSALEQFAEHTASHNPSPSEWTTAYNRIQEAKERAKKNQGS